MNKQIVLLLVVFCVSNGEHLIQGDATKRTLINHTVVQYNSIPFVKRVKTYFYNDVGQNIINSLLVYDNLYSRASATVTAGGVGFTYVNLQFTSERGKGLDYDVGIYA